MPLYVEIRLENNIGFWYQSWEKMYLVKNTGRTYLLVKKSWENEFQHPWPKMGPDYLFLFREKKQH